MRGKIYYCLEFYDVLVWYWFYLNTFLEIKLIVTLYLKYLIESRLINLIILFDWATIKHTISHILYNFN